MNSSDSWVSIPRAIIEELSSMATAEALCTLLLAVDTYGRNSKTTRLTYADIQERTMLRSRNSIAKALRAVADRGLFHREGGSTWEVSAAPPANHSHSLDSGANSLSPATGTGSIPGGNGSLLPRSDSIPPNTDSVRQSTASVPRTVRPAQRGTDCEPSSCAAGTEIEPLPLYKERNSIGIVSERERKRARARDANHVDRSERSGGVPAAATQEEMFLEIPRPRTAEELELAGHPAAKIWLETGFAWPGWERLEEITERMGREPQHENLLKARKMWLMAGYRIENIGGVLDWYQALCRDPCWQPFVRRGSQTVPVVQDIDTPQSPAMAMLFKMKEEIINGKSTDDGGLSDYAASGISAPGSWTANHQDLPGIAG